MEACSFWESLHAKRAVDEVVGSGEVISSITNGCGLGRRAKQGGGTGWRKELPATQKTFGVEQLSANFSISDTFDQQARFEMKLGMTCFLASTPPLSDNSNRNDAQQCPTMPEERKDTQPALQEVEDEVESSSGLVGGVVRLRQQPISLPR